MRRVLQLYRLTLFIVCAFLLQGCFDSPAPTSINDKSKRNTTYSSESNHSAISTSRNTSGNGTKSSEEDLLSVESFEGKRKSSDLSQGKNNTNDSVSVLSEGKPTDNSVRKSATDDRINTCRKLCVKASSCEASKQKSFCKWDQESPSCFGLSWTDAQHTDVCFTRDSQCKGDHPVKCGVVNSAASGIIQTVDFLTREDRTNSCQGLCAFANGCSKSVCTDRGKTRYPICGGLYWDNYGRVISPKTVSFEIDHENAILNGKVPVECGVIDYATEFIVELPKQKSEPIRSNDTT